MIKNIIVTSFMMLFAAFSQFALAADPTWQGTIWTLETDNIDYDATANKQFQVLLTVDTTGYVPAGSPTPIGSFYIDQVAIKVSSALTGASLLSAPGGTGNWTTVLGGVNASGCSGSGSGFDCVNSGTNGSFNEVPAGIYSWLFALNMNSSTSLNFADLSSSVKGRFVNSSGTKVGDLVSENVTLTLTTPVPEPEIYAMLAAGLGLMGFVARRRKQQVAAV